MKNQFKIYANYGVLGREKRVVYSYGVPMVEANDELIVELPENDVLQGKENPCFYALDRDAKGHRVNLNIVEE